MNQEIPYLDKLMDLVEHQHQHDYPVRHRFLVVAGDDRHVVVIHALKKEGPDAETAEPLAKHPNTDPLRLWAQDDYVRIVEGGIARGTGVFRLTCKATGMKRA